MARIGQVLAGEATWGAWWLDQLGHTGLGAAWAVFPTAASIWWEIGEPIVVSSAAALLGGIGREIYQGVKSGKLHPLDRALDAVFHLPGAPIAYGLVQLVLLFF